MGCSFLPFRDRTRLRFPLRGNLLCRHRLTGAEQHATGVLYLDGFESLVIGTKKEHPCGVLFPTLS